MKKLFLLLLVGCTSLCYALTPTDVDKARCYMENTTDSTITFLYPMGTGYFSQATLSSLYIYGSMNGWGQDERYRMKLDAESNCYFVTLKWSVMNIPGNSGHPEFKFYRNGSWVDNPSWMSQRFAGGNSIVIFSYEDAEAVWQQSAFAQIVRPLSNFDLTDPEDQRKISNFRQVPATTCLYRSYHPFHAYRAKYDTEHMRLVWIDSLATRAGIVNDICLSENETGKMNTYTCGGVQYQERIPAYYQQIIANNGVLYVGTQNGSTPGYNDVYFNPTAGKFGQWVAEVVDFIISPAHPGPFQIHCALGTDRTGVFSATLAALCGATWQQVADDYQYTNNMQIEEYRDRGILAYSFRQMCGVYDMNEVSDLQAALSAYFIRNGYLTAEKITCLQQKLNGIQPSVIPDPYVIPKDTAAGKYKDITVKCYSPSGAPTIWWWNGGDRITKASNSYYEGTTELITWNTRPTMPSLRSLYEAAQAEHTDLVIPDEVDGWYYWTFHDVDAGLGIDYIFTTPGNSKSADLNAKQDECRDASYQVMADCIDLPRIIKGYWNVSDPNQFTKTVYKSDTVIDGLMLHCYDKDARRFEITADTLGGFTRSGLINGAAKETYRYLTLQAEAGDRLTIYARGGSNIDRELKIGRGSYNAENVLSSDSIYADRLNKMVVSIPSDSTYFIYTVKGNWYFYAAELDESYCIPTVPIKSHPTALEEFSSPRPLKIIREGRVLILREGRIYDLYGERQR